MSKISLVITCLLLNSLLQSSVSEDVVPILSKDFKFGVSTSNYQIEGAWNEDGKGMSSWDNIANNNPGFVIDKSTGNVACDSYHKYKEDVQNIRYLGVDYYRFSISWSRLFPNGNVNNPNQPGIDYYNNLIDELIKNGIEPAVTLYHWDAPVGFGVFGSWANSIMAKYFAEYAEEAFRLFGDRVKIWFTFNEARIICQEYTYAVGNFSLTHPVGVQEYLCGRTVLKAHAEAYHIYQDKFRATQGGKVGMVFNMDWNEPASSEPEDVEAAERRSQFEMGWFAHPMVHGDWPKVMKDRIAYCSLQEGFSKSRLPALTPEEIDRINGTYDFIAINHYTTFLVRDIPDNFTGRPTYYKDTKSIKSQDPTWEGSESGYLNLKYVPWGLRKFLNWIKVSYNNPEIIISECGYPDYGGLNDTGRIRYYKEYVQATKEALELDGVNVKAFFAWSLMDNFEWINGYLIKFGLFEVNFVDPNRPRLARDSAHYFRRIVARDSSASSLRTNFSTLILSLIFGIMWRVLQ